MIEGKKLLPTNRGVLVLFANFRKITLNEAYDFPQFALCRIVDIRWKNPLQDCGYKVEEEEAGTG